MGTTVMDRPTTGAIKGIALIFMFIHHFFTYPDWYIDGISYPALAGFAEVFNNPSKICVSVFAFLTGYFYISARNKTLGYSLRKILSFLLSYWTAYLALLVPAVMLGFYEFHFSSFVYELAAIYRPVMTFCWYVHFYCTSMLLLPVLNRLSRGSLFGDFLLFLVLPTLVITLLLPRIHSSIPVELLSALNEWFPCTASGYLTAKYGLFRRTLGRLDSGKGGKPVQVLCLLGMTVLAVFGKYYAPGLFLSGLDLGWTMDAVYAAVFVYGCARLLQLCRGRLVFDVLGRIGRQSSMMWFIHCLFFNVCKEKTQWLLYWPRNPLLVLLNGLLMCYGIACLLSVPEGYLQKLLKKCLEPGKARCY